MDDQQTGSEKAIALQYDPDQDLAPRVTAAGKNKLAKKIISLAKKQGIPIHQDPFLADALAQVSISEYIPPELYSLVAEILAYIFRIQQERLSQK